MSRPKRLYSVVTLLLTVGLAACAGGDNADGANDGQDGAGSGGGDASDGEDGGDAGDGTEGDANASVSGTVRVQLYETNDDGDIEFISWPTDYAEEFPFGPVFVAAVRSSLPTNGGLYVGSTLVRTPLIDGNTYTVSMDLDSTESLLMYGALDYWDNRIIHTTDPVGNHPQELTVRPGDVIEGVDFTILAPYTALDGRTAETAGIEDQSDERSYCDDIEVSGDFEVTADTYAERGGDAMAMIYDQDGTGPHDWAEVSLELTDDGGASGAYSVQTCTDQGYVRLVGRWDNNGNGIYDPHDMFGAYATSPGTNGNPVALGSVDIEDNVIEAPLDEDAESLNLVPFIRLSGSIRVEDGFDSMPSGSSVVVAATKYRMEGSIEIESFDENAYAYTVFEWPDLTGQSQMAWSLVVPANTVVYLWGYADENADGVVNQEGEAVVSGGDDDNGRLLSSEATGSRDLVLTDFIGR